MPLVTVIIPNYNHARFLEQRIQSVLAQTFQDFTILLLDDASTDDSRSIIDRYQNNHRFTIVLNEQNSGTPFHQWNLGVSLATTPYVWIAEADDSAEPELLATLVEKLQSHPRAVLAFCQSWMVDEHHDLLGSLSDWTRDLTPGRWEHDFVNDGKDECLQYLRVKNTIPNASAAVFRREAFVAAGGAPEDMRLCGDWMAWARLLMRGDILFSARHLNHFRRHAATVRSGTSAFRAITESAQVLSFIMRSLAASRSWRRQAVRDFQHQWWAALRHQPLPPLPVLYQAARSTAPLSPLLPLKLLGLAFLTCAARSRLAAPLLRWKQRRSSQVQNSLL